MQLKLFDLLVVLISVLCVLSHGIIADNSVPCTSPGQPACGFGACCPLGHVCVDNLSSLCCNRPKACGTTCCSGNDYCLNSGTASCGGCPPGQISCGSGCFDPSNDPNNCGDCGVVCTGNRICSGGHCVCPTGLTDCGGTNCVDEQTDFNHCGSCTNVCPTGGSCSGGTCHCPLTKPSICDNTCVDEQTDNRYCGSCTNSCTGNKFCSAGKCVCPTGLTDCGGINCVNLLNDPQHCGSCTNICGSPSLACCKGECANIENAAGHCGSCTNKCPNTQVCRNFQCHDPPNPVK